MARIKQARAFIASARKAATFETACFLPFANDTEVTMTQRELNAYIKKETELYRKTWILPYLDLAIDILDGKDVDWTPNEY